MFAPVEHDGSRTVIMIIDTHHPKRILLKAVLSFIRNVYKRGKIGDLHSVTDLSFNNYPKNCSKGLAPLVRQVFYILGDHSSGRFGRLGLVDDDPRRHLLDHIARSLDVQLIEQKLELLL